MRRFIFSITLLLSALVPAISHADPAKLLFASGFEGDVQLGPLRGGYQNITGKDSKTGFSWPIRILGASAESGLHMIHHNRQRALRNEIQTVTGHNGRPTRALYNLETRTFRGDTQSPYEILDLTDGKSDLYISYWIKLDNAAWHQPNSWRTFFEWKTKGYDQNTGFRLISFIYTDENGQPYWHWQGDTAPNHPVWEIDNHTIPVPRNKWFLTEFFWHWDAGNNGRALWRINGQIVGDHHGRITRNNKAVDFIMLTQIYGNANPKHQWIDDIEIWDGLPD